jgi:hypothetical protein
MFLALHPLFAGLYRRPDAAAAEAAGLVKIAVQERIPTAPGQAIPTTNFSLCAWRLQPVRLAGTHQAADAGRSRSGSQVE